MVARASIVVQFDHQTFDARHSQLLEEVLALRSLPDRPSSGEAGSVLPSAWFVDRTLASTQLQAAEVLLENVPGASSHVAACAIGAPQGLRDSLTQLLADKGCEVDVRFVHEDAAKIAGEVRFPTWWADYDEDVYAQFIRLVAAAGTPAELTTAQATLLSELADFVATLQMNDGGVQHLHRQSDAFLRDLIELAATLYNFDRGVLASQATVVLDRMERWGGTDPYFALFDNSRERDDPDWCEVRSPEASVQLLTRLFTLGIGQANFAARSLWKATVVDEAAPRLRALLPRLVVSTQHQRMAAIALASLESGPEPECWTASDDPVLRTVAADMIDVMSGDVVSNQLRALLDDKDGYVQEAAVRRVVRCRPADLPVILNRIAGQALPGWMCLSCRTDNPPPGSTSCSNANCYRVGPNPAKLAMGFQLHQSTPLTASGSMIRATT